MKALLLVAAGGAFGSVMRYLISVATIEAKPHAGFPLATFGINVIGCLVAGVLAGLIARYGYFSDEVRALLFVGVLGGFTTFSAFGLETFALLRRGEAMVAGGYVVGSVVLGLAAVALGYWLVHRGV